MNLSQEDIMKGSEEAIPLVIFNEQQKKFELNEEARQYLMGLKAPLGVVAVAGMYRTGKSYLLNRMLLDRNDGFGVGPTINPCTKGVWMWGKPMPGLTPDGEPINVIILDTEGLGALDEDSNHDVRIFSLAILLSSFFIYNSIGSIDENALQNLSLVINLTKHIQIKGSGMQEDIDPEEYAKYFPSFMWVVRDFTLQLVDSEGETISPKEYLEKALASQKGFSDSVEQKNRIRRLLKSFFHERDCVTMIRPLTDEERLQNLIQIPLDELRPEFTEQVHNIRRKVLQRVKPKKINGKNLNGAMFWNLISSYVEAINKGAIPSIESSWAYICKNECQKAAEDAFEVFEKTMAEELQQDGPFYESQLKEFYSSSKKKALDLYNTTAVGDVKEGYLETFKDKMKSKYNQIKQDNDYTCEHECLRFLRQSYSEIERALKNQQYPSFLDFIADMERFQQIFDECGPPGSQRREIMLNFCVSRVMESAEFFIGNVANEMNLQKTMAEEAVKKYQAEIKEIKDDQKERAENLETKLRKAERDKAELSAKEQSSRETLQQLQNEKQQLEADHAMKLLNSKKDFERQIDELQIKAASAEEQQKEITRQQVSENSEFEKQKALLDQKIEFLEKQVEDAQKREREMSSELRNAKKDFLSQNKEQQSVLEKQIKDQTKQIEDQKEQIYEWENKYSTLELQLDEFKSQLETDKQSLQKELRQAKDAEAELKRKLDNMTKKYENECQNLKSSNDNEMLLSNQRVQDLETQLKETQETFELGKQSWGKEQAVLNQKLEFLQYQLDDEKKKFDEAKHQHESVLKTLQSNNRESVIGREEAQTKINDMEGHFVDERKKMEDQYNEYRKKHTDQIEKLKKRNNELELEKKIGDGEHEKQMSLLKEQLSEAELAKGDALNRVKNLDSQKVSQLQQKEDQFMQREQELEAQLDEKEREIEEMIQENNNKSEKQLAELKKFYDDEKERLQQKAHDEKARAEKKMNQVVEDYEDKLQELNNNGEDQYNQLLEEKDQNEAEMQNILNQMEKENQVMQQQLENKERHLHEIKENLNHLQNNSSKQNEALSEKFNKERKEMNERIETLSGEIAKRDRAVLQLENAKEALIQKMQGIDKNSEENKADLLKEKAQQQSKIDDLKQKYDKTMDELTQSKINFEREKALKDQKLQFQDQRIKEYNDQMQQTIDRYEERLKQEKEDAQKNLQERMSRIQQEKESVETKYEQKRKALKELEKNMQQTQAQNDRERAVQTEKYENLERSQQELIKTYEIENQKLQEQNDQLNQALSQGELGIREQVEQWKSQFYEMERQHADLQMEFEKEKALWEGKFDFLEKQKEQAKKDNEDALKQFQQTVDQLHKSQNDQKQKHEHNHGIVMQQLEQKFKKELKEQNEQSQNQINQLNSNIRRLEKENKAINERLEVSNKSMMSEAGGLEKRLERIQEERDRLKDEFETAKSDRDRKIDDMRRQFEREKEILKQKNNDLLQKNKTTEGKQTELILTHETNRAKWDQEKSFLISAKEDAISELKNTQKRYENSVKEIERLKEQQKRNNWRNNKQGANPMMYKVGEGMLGRLNLGGAGQGLNRQGANPDLSTSTSNIGGEMPSYRGGMGGIDKSMDNFKMGFGKAFGNQLGVSKLGQSHAGPLDQIGQPKQFNAGGAVPAKIEPSLEQVMNDENPLDNSMRGSNLLSTPNSKSPMGDDDQ